MRHYLTKADFFARPFPAFGDGIEPTERNMELVREFLLEKWRERLIERKLPIDEHAFDLSDSCKFSALFGSVVFGARICGNYDHVFNVLDGRIIDINAEAKDVKGRKGIYRHSDTFIKSDDFWHSIRSCTMRVGEWLDEFSDIYGHQPAPHPAAPSVH